MARFILGLGRKYTSNARFSLTMVNGTPGFIVHFDGRPDTIYGFDVADGKIVAVHVMRERSKVRAALERR